FRSYPERAHALKRALRAYKIVRGLRGIEIWAAGLGGSGSSVSVVHHRLSERKARQRKPTRPHRQLARNSDGAGRAKTASGAFRRSKAVHAKPRARLHAGRSVAASVGGIPDDGEHAFVVLTGGASEVGVELLGTERRIGKAEAHIILAGRLAALRPARADLDRLAVDAIVRLRVAVLRRVGEDVDRGAKGKRLELTLVAAVFLLRDVTDGCHGYLHLARRETILPCDGGP